jgi:hypothetical protein
MVMVLTRCAGNGTAPHGNGADASRDSEGDVAMTHGYSLPEFPAGFVFHTPLPPTFAPSLPLSGEEATREPPEADFYNPASPYFFSYLFIWWLTGTPDLSTTGLRDDLRLYYAGLCPSGTVSVSPVWTELVAIRDSFTCW